MQCLCAKVGILSDFRGFLQLSTDFVIKTVEDKILTSARTRMVHNNNTITMLADGRAVIGYSSSLMACATFTPLIMAWQVLKMLFL